MLKPLLDGLNAIYGPIMFIVGIAGAVFMVKSGVGKSASEVQANAIAALREEMDVLKGRIDNLKEENKRQERIIRTICSALKMKGIAITIDGETINIDETGHRKSTTVVRIQDKDEDK